MLTEVLSIVREAGKQMLAMSRPEVYEKGGKANFVSSSDIAVQAYLMERLSALAPQSTFFAEEKEENQLEDGDTWVIDPIDGTTNYLHGYQHSSISVALLRKKQAVLGVVLNPYLDELFYAEKGGGAFVNGSPIHVSDRGLDQGLIGFGTSPYYRELADKSFSAAREFHLAGQDIRRSGSAALDICYVGAGRMEAFFEWILSPWDYAAASLITQEAGGTVSSFHGEGFCFDHPIPILAANAACYQSALAILDKFQ